MSIVLLEIPSGAATFENEWTAPLLCTWAGNAVARHLAAR